MGHLRRVWKHWTTPEECLEATHDESMEKDGGGRT